MYADAIICYIPFVVDNTFSKFNINYETLNAARYYLLKSFLEEEYPMSTTRWRCELTLKRSGKGVLLAVNITKVELSKHYRESVDV